MRSLWGAGRWPIGRQLGRAWRLGRDLVGVLRAIGRTFGWALRAPVVEPALALLEGAPLARLGTPSAYRLRAYNPCTAPRSLRVLAIGWLDGVADAQFQVEWDEVLEPGTAAERWIRTDWRGAAALFDRNPGELPLWNAGEVVGRWHIEARLREPAGAALHVSGALVG